MTKILVVDDDKNFRANIGFFLTSRGFDTLLARDGEEGIAKFFDASPQAVLLDVLLPHIGGLDVCRRLRDAGARTPIVLMSAIFKKQDIRTEALTTYGATSYLVKPLDPGLLAAMLTELTGKENDDDDTDSDVELVPLPGAVHPAQGHHSPVPPQGEIRPDTLVRLIQHLHGEKACGVLEIVAGETKRMIFVLNGHPVFASASDNHDPYTAGTALAILANTLAMTTGTYRFEDGIDFLDYVPLYDLPLSSLEIGPMTLY